MNRTVVCADALQWLESHNPAENCVVVGSLPDFSEFPSYSLEKWQSWFISAARLLLTRTHPTQATIFFQSDIKHNGTWVDKAFLCQKAAELEGKRLLWHKIFCRVPPGQASFGKPGYSHLLSFSSELTVPLETSTADVNASIGEKLWPRGMGFEVCDYICRFSRDACHANSILNAFCGRGSLLAVANAYGLQATGIERSPKRAEIARTIQADLKLRDWGYGACQNDCDNKRAS